MILTLAQVQQYAAAAGFSGSSQSIIVAIAQAESSFDTAARHTNAGGSIDRGILQINNVYHAEVSDSQAFSPGTAFQAGYRISSSGTDFTPWSTYTSGAYRQFLSNASGVAYKSSNRNIYAGYLGQCTWWAAERYHQLSNVWVPWSGNAYQWANGAQSNGWQVTPTAPVGLPSIICLAGYAGQGANSTYGHVGVVESVNADGTITTSNMNWASGPVIETVQGYPIRRVTFSPGVGVSFLYASIDTGGVYQRGLQNILPKGLSLAANASVTAALVAMDSALNLANPFNVTSAQQDSIAGVSFTDPVSWLAGFGTNIVTDLIALILRLFLLLVALFLIYRVIAQFVDVSGVASNVSQSAQGLAKTLAPLVAA